MVAKFAGDFSQSVDIVIPTYNEEKAITACVETLVSYVEHLGLDYTITVADNGSTDATPNLVQGLVEKYEQVRLLRIVEKGKGIAIRTAWAQSTADIVAYMDVDLSTDLNALGALLMPLMTGHSEVAIGTRLSPSSRVERGTKREFVSRGYNLLMRVLMNARFSDAHCGFKAFRTSVAQQLIPYVKDNTWFFDAEILLLAERAGYRITEVPVDWVDDPDTKVDIFKTAKIDLQGMCRVRRAIAKREIPFQDFDVVARPGSETGKVIRFIVIGVMTTVVYTVLFWVLTHILSNVFAANFTAMLLAAIVNTIWNRAYTFQVDKSDYRATDHIMGVVVFLVGYGFSSMALWLLHYFDPGSHAFAETAVVTLANLVVTLVKYICFRIWFSAQET